MITGQPHAWIWQLRAAGVLLCSERVITGFLLEMAFACRRRRTPAGRAPYSRFIGRRGRSRERTGGRSPNRGRGRSSRGRRRPTMLREGDLSARMHALKPTRAVLGTVLAAAALLT